MRTFALSFFIILTALASGLGAAEDIAVSAASLGKLLFFDKRLSSDQTLACASCHIPEKAFTNGQAVARGVHGQMGDRNVPTLINRGGTHRQFWDMRAESLEDQAALVLSNPSEMGGDIDTAVKRLNADAAIRRKFQTVYQSLPTKENLGQALAAYESTLFAGEAPFDRYENGDLSALSAAQLRGKELFFQKFKCASCHSGANFTDEKLNVRCYPFTTNLVPAPLQRFKTPTLRNLIYTAPYMHNGALKTLEDAVEFYNPSLHLDAKGKPDPASPAVHINKTEKMELVAFLTSLSAARAFVEKSGSP